MPPDPEPGELARAVPEPARPRAAPGEARISWVGHATHLIQLPGLTLLTDPIWSARASPLRHVGTRRFVPALPAFRELPPIDGVLLSHDHYDHLDASTVTALQRREPDLAWFVPLSYRDWFRRRGVDRVVELDWWEEASVEGTGHRIAALPARHWTRRTPWGTNRRLWASWMILPPEPGGAQIYFGGDTGYASHFQAIGERYGPATASILPIGAYEPRWFMKASHMNPEEAVDAWEDLGGAGLFLPSHWGTFRLTFEDPLEPPRRLRTAWEERGHDPDLLHVPAHGETVRLEPATGR